MKIYVNNMMKYYIKVNYTTIVYKITNKIIWALYNKSEQKSFKWDGKKIFEFMLGVTSVGLIVLQWHFPKTFKVKQKNRIEITMITERTWSLHWKMVSFVVSNKKIEMAGLLC
jgi:hypothetical protein